MKKIIAFILCAVMLCAVMVGCGDSGKPAPAPSAPPASEAPASPDAAPAEAKTLKVASINGLTSPAHLGLEKFEQLVEEASGGAIQVDIYGNGVIASGENETYQMVVEGSMDSALIMGLGCFQGNNPLAAVDEMPFLFSDAESARAAYDGEFGDALREKVIEPGGVKLVCYWESGFRHFTNNIRAITTPEDMQGIKWRAAATDYRLKMFELLGINAIVINGGELFAALQQGTVDGQENGLAGIMGMKFNEVQKYLSLSNHIYNTAMLMVNPDKWDSFTADEQAIIQSAAEECREYVRGLLDEAEEGYIQAWIDGGGEVNEIDHEAFASVMQPEYDMYIEQVGDEGAELIAIAQKFNK